MQRFVHADEVFEFIKYRWNLTIIERDKIFSYRLDLRSFLLSTLTSMPMHLRMHLLDRRLLQLNIQIKFDIF